jgi:hypothetical protein
MDLRDPRDDLLTPLEMRVAVRLGIFFNCRTGQCNPCYARLARACPDTLIARSAMADSLIFIVVVLRAAIEP